MRFRAFFREMPPLDRAEFAARAGSTVGYLDQVAYGNKQIELGLADVLVALSGGELTLDDVPLTDRAKRQRAVRSGQVPDDPDRHAAPEDLRAA